MKVAILPSAKRDLERGMVFYESQQQGLGGYFLESIGFDIDPIETLGGIHPVWRDLIIVSSPRVFPTGFITGLIVAPPMSRPSWMHARIPPKFFAGKESSKADPTKRLKTPESYR